MRTKDLVYVALFAAVTAALGLFPPIAVPVLAVPITAQSLGPMLAGAILGAKRGALAIALLLILVAIGLPLLSGGRGGFGVFLGPSGGFLVGWVLAAFVTGWLFERSWSTLTYWTGAIYTFLGGVVALYTLGIGWLAVAANLSLFQAAAGSVAFIPGDIVKVLIATTVALAVKRSYPIIEERSDG
ncbi:biotin transporter BioY [Aestuariivita sp.]|jgi:biotin transport system substrate-specific component|uniref:biotin transporter BioY n=1 Tax=Aestuariivita sp. TaxID=1872407 RepID=UPI0021738E54|nr:biotin transporter BioY [Aestuariivita sp.]MCE8009303.1 biotin transporter BioY [Aestuariivita sp.]